ncbi:MAG: type I-C CRISPR-associated protein Cas7/Csd2 [Nitrospira sp.]|nr:type I-C CRISPR-associated protein Cas7/Csd2 [Nitrospira sp.]
MAIQNRYDFVLLFDVKDGNPNGDPDAGNLPRLDAETGQGLVTDVCLKRKVRNLVGLVKKDTPRYGIFVKEKAILNEQIERAYEDSSEVKAGVLAWQAWQKDKKKNPKPARHYEDLAREWMCNNFFDVRTFGAVMSTSDKQDADGSDSKLKKTAGQVRGPVQMTFARSVDRIVTLEHSITVCAARKADKPIEEQIGIQGRKHTVPYGLYVAHGFISSFLAKQTFFSDEDLSILWDALSTMFEHDRSAARSEMATRGLYIFKHDLELGNAPAHKLFDLIQVKRSNGSDGPPRSFSDYSVTSPDEGPIKDFSGVTFIKKV